MDIHIPHDVVVLTAGFVAGFWLEKISLHVLRTSAPPVRVSESGRSVAEQPFNGRGSLPDEPTAAEIATLGGADLVSGQHEACHHVDCSSHH